MPSRSKRPAAKGAGRGTKPKPKPKPDPGTPPGGVPPGIAPPAPGPGPAPPPGTPPRPTLDDAVRDLNGLYVPGALGTALAMASYLLSRFLGGEEDGFNPQLEAPSLRELARRTDLSFSAPFLSVAIGVYQQHPLLDPALAAQLSLSHHRLLLGIPDTKGKNQLAALAVRKRLDVEDLKVEVRAYRRRHNLPPIGRPPDHPVLHGLRRIYRQGGDLLEELEQPLPPPLLAEARSLYRAAAKRLAKAGEIIEAAARAARRL